MASAPVPRKPSIRAPYSISRLHHPSTLTMVLEAVQVLCQPKGVSVFAIKRYILHTYPFVNAVRLKYYLKQALMKGVNQGYLERPPRSSARGASGSFKLGKKKIQLGKSLEKKSSSDKTAAKPKTEAAKQPKAKAPKQKPERKGAEQVKKKALSKKPEAALGDDGATVSGAEPKGKSSGKKPAKATKEQSAPKSPLAKPAHGAKKGRPKTKAELKGVPEVKVKSKPQQDEKAKGDAVPKTARAKKVVGETKAKGKPKAKKRAARGLEKEESTAESEA
ncbi:histone H1.8 [Paroedura picta]|uniref:histone H1.8 n=1 Tax=Paroedura picta TaxID=143630 RepID=UPI004055EB1D